ncbi:MAG: 30S ribosomal protein S3, partial [Chloroflexi bacterium]|nr:30S ribosomal protein S3 [Chloroflexota bacterium]
RKGQNVNVLKADLEKLTGKKVHVDVKEIARPEMDAFLVADSIAGQLERRVAHKRAMKQSAQRTMRMGALGIKIVCAGRLSGSEMARRDKVIEGSVPLHTLRADIDFAKAEALTTFGRIGVKVWIYKGEVLPPTPEELVVKITEASDETSDAL